MPEVHIYNRWLYFSGYISLVGSKQITGVHMWTISKASSLGIFSLAALFISPSNAQQENETEISIEEIVVEFDTDGDMNISQEEFQRLYQEKFVREQVDEEQSVSSLFAKLDVNNNKELDTEEMNSDTDFRTQLNQSDKID
jgi:hypothetical protein